MAEEDSHIVLWDILDFSSNREKELEERFGKKTKTWDEVKSWDDCVIPEEKAIIELLREIGGENCPYFRTEGKYFNFCGVNAKKYEKLGHPREDVPSPLDARYCSKVGHFHIQLWCMNEKRYCKCREYLEENKA